MNIAKDILQNIFKHNDFRNDQEEIINKTINNEHCLVLMPTGMGKSLCFQIPALIKDGLCLVISPLIALMQDQVDNLQKKDIDAIFINSSLTKKERLQKYADLQAGKHQLLFVTPERFRKKEFVTIIQQRKISLLAVDEAHCISEWGHDFRPDYTRLAKFRSLAGNPTTIALTATATPEVQEDIIKQLGLKESEVNIFHQGLDRPNLKVSVQDSYGVHQKIAAIKDNLQATSGNAIIYFSLIKTLETYGDILRQEKIPHKIYHGRLEPNERRQTLRSFMAGENNVILATNAFGLGVDKDNIRQVIHAEIPGSMESYYQEIGRAGRDGKPAKCTLLYDQDDLLIQMDFIKWNNPEADLYQRLWALLDNDLEEINSLGLDYAKERLLYKQKFDFRLETALAMFDRYGVTSGRLDCHNLKLTTAIPSQLTEKNIAQKILSEQKKLHLMVQYCKIAGCRKGLIHDYFGIDHTEYCDSCDNC